MKKLIILACLLLPALASASPATTTPSTLACTTKAYYSNAIDFIIAKDMGSLEAYINQNKCIVLKGGLRVTITDAGFMTHEFVIQGITLYTASENLKLRR